MCYNATVSDLSILDEIHAKREEICAVAKRRERQVIAKRYRAVDVLPDVYELAKKLGVTKRRVDEIKAKAEKLLRKFKKSRTSAFEGCTGLRSIVLPSKEFIESHFDAPDVEMFVHGLDEDGCISVRVEDEDGGVVFEDEQYGNATQRGFILTDRNRFYRLGRD